MSHRAEFIIGKKDLLEADTQAKIDHWVSKFPPEHKRSALIQALIAAQDQNGGWINKDMIEAVAGLEKAFAQKGWPPIAVGVGVSSGEMNVGNMGSEFRIAYTVKIGRAHV